jgi:amylosucrase
MGNGMAKERRAQVSLDRLLPRLEQEFRGEDWAGWNLFLDRVEAHFPRLFGLLIELYGHHYDFFYHLERILALAARTWFERSHELKELDARRLSQPYWFQSQEMLGGVYYVDLFAGDLAGLRQKIPYFKNWDSPTCT